MERSEQGERTVLQAEGAASMRVLAGESKACSGNWKKLLAGV